MSRYKYIIFVTLVFFITRGLYLQTGLSSAYGAGLSATDSIAPGEDAQLPFGEVAVGKSSSSGDVTVKNNSGSVITISSINLTGPHAASFRLSLIDSTATSCGSLPKTLPDGESCTLSVLFAPGLAGLQAAFLDISLGNNIVEKIAFEDITTNGISLYDISSNSVTPLTNPVPAQEDRDPSWSPNGRQIVFNRHNQDGSDDISLKNIDDIDIPVVNILIAGNRAGGTMPAWSPDGGTLAFRNEQFGGISLWRFGPIFVDLGNVVTGERFNPSWSPDGREILFQRTDPFLFSKDIFKLTIDSNNQDNFSEQKIISNGRTPSWSPDGARIAYHDNTTKGIFIHTLNGATQQLTFPVNGNRDLHPSWSPDGNQIVFHRASSNDLIVVNVSDGSVDDTFIDLKKGKNPAWSPPLSNLALALSGTGTTVGTNSPPSAPQLISPDKGAQEVSTNVMFKWLEGIDPEGDPVIHELKVCEDNQFSFGCIPTNDATLNQQTMFFARMGTVGGSTLLLFGVGVVFLTRRHSAYGSLILCGLITATLLAGCSGGGGGGRSAPFTATEKEEMNQEITGLKTNQDYFWKVTARDDQGNATPSEVRQFTTRP